MRLPAVPASALISITDDLILNYCKALAYVIRSVSHQVEEATLQSFLELCHDLSPGDYMLVKKHVVKTTNLYSLKKLQE